MPLSHLVCLVTVLACQLQPEPVPPLSMKVEHLLQIVLNPKTEVRDLKRAARDFAGLKVEKVWERLSTLVAADDEAVAYRALIVLGEVGLLAAKKGGGIAELAKLKDLHKSQKITEGVRFMLGIQIQLQWNAIEYGGLPNLTLDDFPNK